MSNHLTVQRLSGGIGAEIRGIDLGGEVSDDTIAAIRRIWLDHNVIVLHRQTLPPDRFLALAHRLVHVPPRAHRVLRQIPPAALAALVFPALLRPEGHLDLWQARLAAGVLAALVAWRTRNVALTLLVGMGALLVIQAL